MILHIPYGMYLPLAECWMYVGRCSVLKYFIVILCKQRFKICVNSQSEHVDGLSHFPLLQKTN